MTFECSPEPISLIAPESDESKAAATSIARSTELRKAGRNMQFKDAQFLDHHSYIYRYPGPSISGVV